MPRTFLERRLRSLVACRRSTNSADDSSIIWIQVVIVTTHKLSWSTSTLVLKAPVNAYFATSFPKVNHLADLINNTLL